MRTALGLTQAALARAAGVSQGTIGNIESGQRGYGESLVDIAKALEVSAAYLRCEPNAPISEADSAVDAAMFVPAGTVVGTAAPVQVGVPALYTLGKAIEQASPADRASAIALLTTFIEDPKSNMDLMPLIAKRLSGELEPERLTAVGGSK